MMAEGASSQQVKDVFNAAQAEEVSPSTLSVADQALLRYADKLTRTPAAINESDIEQLRRAGLDDRAVHDACAITAYYAFVNRIADGLGVELET